MNKRIRITAGAIELSAELNETKTAQAIWAALPIKGEVNRWGDEIYFSIPLKLEAENAKELVSNGDLGYWPPDTAFCVFFGPTPMSQGDEIRPASAVNIFGRVSGDTKLLKQVNQGAEILIERES
jgi:hypothetical protein